MEVLWALKKVILLKNGQRFLETWCWCAHNMNVMGTSISVAFRSFFHFVMETLHFSLAHFSASLAGIFGHVTKIWKYFQRHAPKMKKSCPPLPLSLPNAWNVDRLGISGEMQMRVTLQSTE